MLSDRDYYHDNDYRRALRSEGSVLKPLILINVAIFILCNLGSGGESFHHLLVLHPYNVRHGEIWRLASYMFAHGGLFHILVNMWGLFIFGRPVEQRLGPRRFLNLYLFSGLLGGFAWLAANWSAPSFSPGVVGASGSLFGVMVAAAIAFPDSRIGLLFPPVVMKLRTMVICFAAIEIWQSFDQSSSIAHLAHLGGAAGGFLYMRRMKNKQSNLSWWQSLKLSWQQRQRRRKIQKSWEKQNERFQQEDNLTEKVDDVLEKLAEKGYDQLTEQEKKVLQEASDRLKARRGR